MEEFKSVSLKVSKVSLAVGETVNIENIVKFFKENGVFRLTPKDEDPKKEDEDKTANDFGTDFLEEDELEETEEETAEEKEEKKAKEYWKKRQDAIIGGVVSLRKREAHVSKIERKRKGKTYVVLCVTHMDREEARKILEAYFSSSEIKFYVETLNETSLPWHELANLLLGLLPYKYTPNFPETAYPSGGYRVKADEKKESNPKYPSKISFSKVYLEETNSDGIVLRCTQKAFFRMDKWVDGLTEKDRLESLNGAHYSIVPTGIDDFLANGADKSGTITDVYYRSKWMDRMKINVRAVGRGQESHEKTKETILSRAILRFNDTFGDMITLTPITWNAKKHWTEVVNTEKEEKEMRNGPTEIENDHVNSVNRVRTVLEEAGGFSILLSDTLRGDGKKEKRLKNQPENDFVRAQELCGVLISFYKEARYEASVDVKELKEDKACILFPEKQEGDYKILHIEYECTRHTTDEEKEMFNKRTILLSSNACELKDGFFVCKIAATAEKVSFRLFLDKEYDIPLSYTEKVIYFEGETGKKHTRDFLYRYGFGVRNGSIMEKRQTEDSLCIELMSDNKGKAYKSESRLSVQHFAIYDAQKMTDGESDPKMQKVFYELSIKATILDQEIPYDGVQVALLALYVPRDKKKKIKAHFRYFLWEQGEIRELREEELEECKRWFPKLGSKFLDHKDWIRENRYFLKTDLDTYYIERTNIVPLGSSEVGEDGRLIKSFHGKGVESMVENMPGGFGISFYHEKDLIGVEDIIYYCSAGARKASDIQAGLPNFPNTYKVFHENTTSDETYLELYTLLTDTTIRLKQYSTILGIFKYIKEWARVSGRR